MPGPGAHMMYTLAVGSALMRLTRGSFSPHHCLVYALNAFLGPDLGSFAEWLSSVLGLGRGLGSSLMDLVHDPLWYTVLLGFPLCVFYSWVSSKLHRLGLLDSISGVPLNRKQCLFLVSAGSLSHFFLDHLFEENGNSKMYKWVLSTGWWKGTAPIDVDSVLVIGLLCSILLAGFVYINRVKNGQSVNSKSNKSLLLIYVVATLYCMWCAFQNYLRNPPRPAIGEEADLGVIIFLGIYFFIPHGLCILSMNQRDLVQASNQLPL
ncbi:polyprotein [Rhynchospora pubera]|nr:polyprotein [Rhynchospora pubera]